MTLSSEKIVEAACTAFLAVYGDPAAEPLDYRKEVTAALLAVLPMVAEEIAALVDDRSIPVVRARFSSLIEDLK